MVVLHLKAKPGSRTSQLLVGPNGAAPARLVNVALQKLLAATFGLAKRDVTRPAGHTAPFRKVELAGLSDENLARALAELRAWQKPDSRPLTRY